MTHPALRPPRRWPIVLPTVIVVVLAIAWTGLWFYAAARAGQTLDGWRAREAKAGRIYTCRSHSIGGYPFRIEIRCANPQSELRSSQPPLKLRANDLRVAAQIYQPTLLISEIDGPLSIGAPDSAPRYLADWKLAQTSVRGTPQAPERVSIVLDEPMVQRVEMPTGKLLLTANRIEIHGRMAGGSAKADPVIELGLRLDAASAPDLTPLAVQPVDAVVSGLLRGLKDFSAKPWRERFRELQERSGRLEVTHARIQQGEVIMTATGTLGLSARGRLDGELRATIAGVEKLLKALGIDRPPPSGQRDQLAPAVEALNRIAPGLGNLARKHAGSTIAAGIGLLGERAVLEGKQAVIVPLRFDDGAVFLGPLKVGDTPPLY